MHRDQALILLAGGLAALALVCATSLVLVGHAPTSLGNGAVMGVVGLAGVALGRLGGPPPPTP